MWDQIRDLHACHREVAVEISLLKLTEEVGEAAEAFNLGTAGCRALPVCIAPTQRG
jgi:NTP pyrophosphatase (non-canonical NTP hydrolase)